MSLLQKVISYVKSFKLSEAEYVPTLWEDDYGQIELVPRENLGYLRLKLDAVAIFAKENQTDQGFTQSFERGDHPVSLLTHQINAELFRSALISFGLPELQKFRFEGGDIKYFAEGKTRAFGYPSFSLFFETEQDLVSKIWLSFSWMDNGVSEMVAYYLQCLGEHIDLLMVDWNQLELVELKDQAQITGYLTGWLK